MVMVSKFYKNFINQCNQYKPQQPPPSSPPLPFCHIRTPEDEFVVTLIDGDG